MVLSLCPVACLRAYEKATASFRKENRQLFLAVISPHNPVTPSTIARWLKQAIIVSGISPDFTAHSTRGASSTAAAMNGVTICEVMERAGCSTKDTFCKDYSGLPNRPLWQLSRGICTQTIYKHAEDILMEPEPSEVQSENG